MLIEVLRRPNGSAPEKIRDAWIGLVLEAEIFPVSVPVKDPTHEETVEKISWRTSFISALSVLGKRSKEAADWYQQSYPKETQFIAFNCDEAKVVDWSSPK